MAISLELGETRHPKKMSTYGDIEIPHGLIGQEESHAHNVYRKDKHHLKLGSGL